MGAVLETPTWRASRDWGARIGYDAAALARVNRQAVALLSALRDAHEREDTPIVVSGNLGPRADGYSVRAPMSASEAEAYHTEQVDTFTRAGADMVSALTLNYVEEAVGIVRAARASAIPVAISFTVETDGRLPAGQGLAEAMQATDEATGDYAAYFMVNCAHPSHFEEALAALGESRERIRGIRANASRRSHAELDVSTELDEGDPEDLAAGYRRLSRLLPRLSVVGGCCGTDQRHVGAICSALAA
jgi:S-methylmethionine-dependent homocysteine/selenocysteine methylase